MSNRKVILQKTSELLPVDNVACGTKNASLCVRFLYAVHPQSKGGNGSSAYNALEGVWRRARQASASCDTKPPQRLCPRPASTKHQTIPPVATVRFPMTTPLPQPPPSNTTHQYIQRQEQHRRASAKEVANRITTSSPLPRARHHHHHHHQQLTLSIDTATPPPAPIKCRRGTSSPVAVQFISVSRENGRAGAGVSTLPPPSPPPPFPGLTRGPALPRS